MAEENITPQYNLIPSSSIPGGISDVSTDSTSSGTLVQPKGEDLGQTVGPMTATANTLSIGSANEVFNITSLGIWLGAANFSDAPFSVDMEGNLIATSGHFSGDITGATGTFSGTVTIGSLDIPNATTANSFHVDTLGNAWWGATTLGSATAKVLKTGVATFTDIVATGTINATGGYIGSTTALVFESQGINTGTTGYIRGGQTAYNTGTGYFLGYESAIYKFSIGDGSTNFMTWNGTIFATSGLVTYKNGTAEKAVSDASTTQNIAHGMGKVPNFVKFTFISPSPVGGGSLNNVFAIYNGTTTSVIGYAYANGALRDVSGTSIKLLGPTGGNETEFQTGVITYDTTNLIITWTKTNSPTGTYKILWETYS